MDSSGKKHFGLEQDFRPDPLVRATVPELPRSAWQSRGQGFESPYLHRMRLAPFGGPLGLPGPLDGGCMRFLGLVRGGVANLDLPFGSAVPSSESALAVFTAFSSASSSMTRR